jgi:hypothetical protein
MCAAHAQIQTAAELSVALRLDAATRSDVRSALWEQRTLVRTFGPAVGDACGEWAVARVMPAFQTAWPRWRQVVSTAAARGALCFGPNRGREITYASPRRWLAGFAPAPADQGLPALIHAYMASFGPASPAHFARWLAAPATWAAAQFESLGERIEPVKLNGETCWVNTGDRPEAGGSPDGLWLLPYFDAYVVGAQPRGRVFPGRAADRALARTQAGNFPVLLLDGVVAGVWHQRRVGRRIRITVEPLRRLIGRQRRALDDAAERVAVIQDGRPELATGELTVGPHA